MPEIAVDSDQKKAFEVFDAWDKGRYQGLFSDYGSFMSNFDAEGRAFKPEPEDVFIAVYEPGDYSGRAFALFLHEGKLYEVHGSHCSCNGLEECWDPSETDWATLKMRDWSDWGEEAEQRMQMLFEVYE